MGYATQADLLERYGPEASQLSDPENTGAPDPAIIARVLSDADSKIDAYLAAAFVLPISASCPALTRVACDLALYFLYGTIKPEAVQAAYRDAVAFLVGVRDGKTKLTDAAGNVIGGSGATPATSASVKRSMAFGADFEATYGRVGTL